RPVDRRLLSLGARQTFSVSPARRLRRASARNQKREVSMSQLSAAGRQHSIERMMEDEFDIAIIGGGICGAGVARDAASRGLKVALIEAGDFASGTSSRSSKLIHGGIRYLEN